MYAYCAQHGHEKIARMGKNIVWYVCADIAPSADFLFK